MYRISNSILIIFFSFLTLAAMGPKNEGLKIPTLSTKDTGLEPRISWIGVGDISHQTITSTGSFGFWQQPGNWPGYDGGRVEGHTTGDGNVFEYPAGTSQYYNFDAGPWFGGIIAGAPRVAAGAYYSSNDLAPIVTLYQSDQFVPGFSHRKFVLHDEMIDHPLQTQWTYTDLSLNSIRSMENALLEGTFTSDQDSYTQYGDYIPEEEAQFLNPLGGYDGQPLGVKVVQRTYSFFQEKMIFAEFTVTNMTDSSIHDFYFGFFTDNDIGEYRDDLIGFDITRNMIYSYDSDSEEIGWGTPAGYIGTVLLNSPMGLTGAQTWTPGSDEGMVDMPGQDQLKYDQLTRTTFETFDTPQDVRQLMCSGPVAELLPGASEHFAIALIAADDSLTLFANAERAQTIFAAGYILPYARLQYFTVSDFSPQVGETILLRAKIDHPSDSPPDSVLAVVKPFNGVPIKIYLHDDGNSGDQEAGDHWFEGEYIVPETGFLTFEIGVFNAEKDVVYENNMPAVIVEQQQFAAISGTSLPVGNQVNLLNENYHFGESFSVELINTSNTPLADITFNLLINEPNVEPYFELSNLPDGYTWQPNTVFNLIPSIDVTPDPAFIKHDQKIAYQIVLTNNENGHTTELSDTLIFIDNLPPYPESNIGILPIGARRLESGNHQSNLEIIETAGIKAIEVALLSSFGELFRKTGAAIKNKELKSSYNIQWTVPSDTTGIFRVGVRLTDSLDNSSDWFNLGEFSNQDFAVDGNILFIDMDYNNLVYYSVNDHNKQPEYYTWLRNDPSYETRYIELLEELSHSPDIFRPDIDDWTNVSELMLGYDFIFINTGALNYTSSDLPDLNQHYSDFFHHIEDFLGTNPYKVMFFAESNLSEMLSYKSSPTANSFPYFITSNYDGDGSFFVAEDYSEQLSGFSSLHNHRPLIGSSVSSRFNTTFVWDEIFLQTLDYEDVLQPISVTHFAPDLDVFGRSKVICTSIGLDLWKNQDFARDYLAFGLDWLDTFTSVDQVETQLPTELTLYANYPNPFNPATTIEYYLPKAGEVTLEVFNVLGQKVATLTDGLKSAGKQTVLWDATDMRGNAVASGTYFYQLRTGGKILNKRMVLIK
jgi:hypothetical protein